MYGPLLLIIMMTEVFRMEGISKAFPGVQALKDVTLGCLRGEVHAIVGENGAGKSTLIKILSGVFPPDLGRIIVEGTQRAFRSPVDAQRVGIRAVHQELSLVPFLTVAENLCLGLDLESDGARLWYSASDTVRRAREILDTLGLDIDPRILVHRLSVAQQKWVEIAKALAPEPKILILDEPTAPFSDQEVDHLFGLLDKLKRGGTTTVYVSHRLDELFQIADRVTILKDGEYVGTKRVEDVTKEQIIRMMIGRELGELFLPKVPKRRERKVLEVRNLCLGNVLHNVSFELHEGEVLGIGGLKGHGQDVLLRALFGVQRYDKGEVLIEGRKVKIRSPQAARRHGIALVTEKKEAEGLCLGLPIRHNIALPTLHRRQKLGLIRLREETRALQRVIASLAVHATSLNQVVRQLSGGNKQKVVIAKWILAEPKIVFFIDPTMGIDVGTKQQLYRFIRDLVDDFGKSVILVSSELKELLGLCDRVMVMREGRVVAQLSAADASEEKILQAAMGVLPSGAKGMDNEHQN